MTKPNFTHRRLPAHFSIPAASGMLVLSADDTSLGRLAAVLVDRGGRGVTHVVLECWRTALEYRLVPTGVIAAVCADRVKLTTPPDMLDQFTPHVPGEDA